MGIMTEIQDFYKGKRILITGHTGFKGSWLSIWLQSMGAEVIGIALAPSSERDNYVLSDIGNKIIDIRGNICNAEWVQRIMCRYQPEIVFHLAAQPLVRYAYLQPVETYQTNVMGTIHILEAIRKTKSVRVGVMITTDKCYENKEQTEGYCEDDAMGGHDPYSSSKGAAEIAIASWRRSFFYTENSASIASARAGNVIGGGDWATDRIIPDCIRALEANNPIEIRNPLAIRPWQHVLEPLNGYLLLAMRMWQEPKAYCEGWNFGPNPDSSINVWEMASKMIEIYGKGTLKDLSQNHSLHEATLRSLNIQKAKKRLKWAPKMNIEKTLSLTVDWYKRYMTDDVYHICMEQINEYCSLR